MPNEEISITIKKDGTMSYTVQGVQGASCKELTKALDNLSKGGDRGNTKEFYETPPDQTKLYNRF